MEAERRSESVKMRLARHHRPGNDAASAGSNYNGPYFDGISLKGLKKGTLVSFDAVLGECVRVAVTLKITFPKNAGVEVLKVIRLGGIAEEIPKENLGLCCGIEGHFVVRGEVERESELGWIGLGADVRLIPNFKFESVRNIRINGMLILPDRSRFPCH